jgi:four helix bundle protein
MNADHMQKRTKAFALRIIKLSEGLPHTRTAEIIGRQLLRCGTSVGANYRSACRAKSLADFIAKMAIVEEEADEVIYWLDLLVESGLLQQRQITDLLSEADQIVAMTVASIKTARRNKATTTSAKR